MARAYFWMALLAIVASGTASAGTYGFGTIVGKADWDYTPNPAGTSRVGLCFVDENGDARYSMHEPLYLDLSGYVNGTDLCVSGSLRAELAIDDVRIVAMGPFAAGTGVGASDSDLGHPLSGPVPHFLRYYDVDGDSKFKGKDTLYIDISNLAAKKVTAGDIRLTRSGSLAVASTVASGDADANFPLTDITGAGIGFASDNAVYKAGSAYYINTDGQPLATTTSSTGYNRDYVVEENDVRINAKAENPLADFAAPNVQVVNASTVRPTYAPGQLMQVKVTVRNAGKAPASGLVEIFSGDFLLDSRGTATLAPGQTGSVVAGLVAPPHVGRHEWRSGDVSFAFDVVAAGAEAATLAPATQVVEPQAAPAAVAEANGAPWSGPGLLLAAIGTLAWMRRRNAN